MGSNPFAKRSASQASQSNRRRSTRVDFETPVILSGRDASGRPFREETVTLTVSLHGARVRTAMEILNGMQVTVENSQTGMAEKAVCVRVEAPSPGEATHYVAVQLVRAGNLWGLENPPADWGLDAVATSTQPVASSANAEYAPISEIPLIESQAVPWEAQSAALAESVLQVLRPQVQALMDKAIQEFEVRMKNVETETSSRLENRGEKILSDVTLMIESLRADLARQLAAQGAQAVESAEEDLRARVAQILSPMMGVPNAGLPGRRVDTLLKK
jgi:hypothetical protein